MHAAISFLVVSRQKVLLSFLPSSHSEEAVCADTELKSLHEQIHQLQGAVLSMDASVTLWLLQQLYFQSYLLPCIAQLNASRRAILERRESAHVTLYVPYTQTMLMVLPFYDCMSLHLDRETAQWCKGKDLAKRLASTL